MLVKKLSLQRLFISFAILSGLSWGAIGKATSFACQDFINGSDEASSENVTISRTEYTRLLGALRATIDGNLATVWRSEWKAKLSAPQATQYVESMLQHFLSKKTFNEHFADLNSLQPDFMATVLRRLFELRKTGHLLAEDTLFSRDPPPPTGVKDTTFTYYTKAMGSGEGKHQIRVRTYMRRIVAPEKLEIDAIVHVIDPKTRQALSFKRINENQVAIKLGESVEVLEMRNFILLYASKSYFSPIGANFKLEVKSALTDQIQRQNFPVLGGPHMVEKLDIPMTDLQFKKLFAQARVGSAERARAISLSRLEALRIDLLQEPLQGHVKAGRVAAIIEVLTRAVNADPYFLNLVGATHYQRFSLEGSSGLQTTADCEQSVFLGMYGENGQLRTPSQVIAESEEYVPFVEDAWHVELKFPVYAVQAVNGLEYSDPMAAALVPHPVFNSSDYFNAARIYSGFVNSDEHRGKFRFLQNFGTKISGSGKPAVELSIDQVHEALD